MSPLLPVHHLVLCKLCAHTMNGLCVHESMLMCATLYMHYLNFEAQTMNACHALIQEGKSLLLQTTFLLLSLALNSLEGLAYSCLYSK